MYTTLQVNQTIYCRFRSAYNKQFKPVSVGGIQNWQGPVYFTQAVGPEGLAALP